MATEAPRPRITMVVPLESRGGSLAGDPKLINAYAEKLEGGSYRVLKRQGVGAYQTLTPPGGVTLSKPIGNYYVDARSSGSSLITPTVLTFANTTAFDIYVYFNGANPTKITEGIAAASVGPISCVQYTDKLVAANIPLLGGIFVIDAIAKTATGTGVPFAFTVQGLVELDSTIYVMDPEGIIWGSALNDATTWSNLNFITANSEPGAGIYLAKHFNYVVALKNFSLEFFYDAKNPTGSPLSFVQNSTILWGCVDAFTVQVLGNRIFWLARERQGAYFIAMLDSMQHVKISTPGIDKLVGDPVGPFRSFCFRDSMGHQYYGFTDIGAAYTIVYDIDEQLWLQWSVEGIGYFPFQSIIVHSNNSIIAQSTDPANVLQLYQIDEDFTTDLGSDIIVDIYTPNNDLGTRRIKTCPRMDFITDQQPGYLLSRWSEDDFQTFSQFRRVDLNQKRPTLTGNGSFRRRAWNLRYTQPYSLRIEAIELDLLLGA